MTYDKGLIILVLFSSEFLALRIREFGPKMIESTPPAYEFSEKRMPDTFPEIHGGDALEPTLQLLLSQQKYLEEIEMLFRRLVQKDGGTIPVDSLQTIDGDLIHIEAVLNDGINTIEGYLVNGNATDEEKMMPLSDISSWMLLHLWETIKDWSNNEVDSPILDPEVRAMQEPLRLAIREIKSYDDYLAVVTDDERKLTNASLANAHYFFKKKKRMEDLDF